jgi:hypothetical protein
MDADHDADGIPVRVAELTGQPGDAVLAHPWVLHSHSPNASGYPRIMLTKNLFAEAASAAAILAAPGRPTAEPAPSACGSGQSLGCCRAASRDCPARSRPDQG